MVESPMAAFNRLETARRRIDENAFTPSRVIERLVLQVIGGWELAKAEINFHSFTAVGFGADWNSENPAKAMREIAEARRVRHPHQDFSSAANDVNNVRRRFAHLAALGDTVGERPNRTFNFMRLGVPAEPRRQRGDAVGLSWRDEQWAQQSFHQDSMTEDELRVTLAKEQWMVHVCRGVDHIGAHLAENPDLPDDHKISDGEWWTTYSAGWWVPWTLPEWQEEKRTTLYVRDVRLPAADSADDGVEPDGPA